MENLDAVGEVKSLREVPREPEHCGRKMHKLQGVSPSTGKIKTFFHCEACGHKQEKFEREPVK
jgi:hypothetical protein